MPNKVLVLTGGFLTLKEKSLLLAVRKQFSQWKASEHTWLETKIKLVTAFPVLLSEYHRSKRRVKNGSVYKRIQHLLDTTENFDTPELTEVVLCGSLKQQNIPYEIATFDDLFSGDNNIVEKLERCNTIFASTTFLRDLSELDPILDRLKRTDNRIILGGAMVSTISATWEGHPKVDLVAIGYGEYLIPGLSRWIKSAFTDLKAPATGRLETRKHSKFVFSGVPDSLNLDHLDRPDWDLSQQDHNCSYKMIHYESVRGCPYRCAFCNYPYLFDDKKFRTKSAMKMALDWLQYKNEIGMEFITCLDSLFTMPKRRLIEFCEQLIQLQVNVKWICYARADDLCDESVVILMKKAGAHQVQIGIESGDQDQLNNMNKRTTVDANALALENCRKYGLTTVISLIVGYPGETQDSIERTYNFMKSHPPDFHFLATFSTRVENVPILSDKNKQRFGLATMQNDRTVSPYWKHSKMDCLEATNYQWQLSERLMTDKISLDAALFYKGILRYDPNLRHDMLEYQRECLMQHPRLYSAIKWTRKVIDKRLKSDLIKSLKTDTLLSRTLPSTIDQQGHSHPITLHRNRSGHSPVDLT